MHDVMVFLLKVVFSFIMTEIIISICNRKVCVDGTQFKIFNIYFLIWSHLASYISKWFFFFGGGIFLFQMDFKRLFRKDKRNQDMFTIGKEFCENKKENFV